MPAVVDFDFKGKVALVTGAASGMGRCTALRFARAGAELFLVDLNEEGLRAVERETRELGCRVTALASDVSAQPACASAVDKAVAAFGRIDILCNVAGIVLVSRLAETTTAQWERVLAVNLSGPYFFCQAAMPHLLKANGAIVNVASCAGLIGQAYMPAYTASKAGLIAVTKSLAMEFMKAPVRINAIAPGGVDTPLARNIQMPADADPELIGRFIGMRPVASPEDVADLILFLASDAAAPIHGTTVSVDGGLTSG